LAAHFAIIQLLPPDPDSVRALIAPADLGIIVPLIATPPPDLPLQFGQWPAAWLPPAL
jgi:hypothetical protein